MSDSLTIFVDSEDAGQNIVESLMVVPKEHWGKELRKISSSTAPLKEKINALQADARSIALNARLFEPRSITQLPIPEEERMFGLPFSIHGATNDLSIESPAMGLCRIDNDWVYASTIDSPLPTEFANGNASSDLWKAVWGDNQAKNFNDIAVLDVEGSHTPFSFTEFFKLVPEEFKEIDSYILHQLDVEGTSQDFSLVKAATAQTFDNKRPLYQYDHVLFVLTGVFASSDPRIPAIKTGSGFRQGGRVTILLGTERDPCYILGCGGAPSQDGGVGLEINDSNARFEVFRGNAASILAGGGGGGPAFQCSSKENKSALTVIGGGGDIMGRSERPSLDPGQKTTKASYFSNKNIRRANPPKIRPQGGIIKSIQNSNSVAKVQVLDLYHELYNQDRVYISNTGDMDARSYYVKSSGPREFELYEDLELNSPYAVASEYSASSRVIGSISRVDVEYGLSGAMLIEFGEPLHGAIGDSYETSIEGCSISSYNKGVAIELVDGLGNQTIGSTGWIIPSITGGEPASDGTAYFPDYASGGRWSFIGREGVLEPTTHSIPGYKDITVSGNGGWFGESGQFTVIDKIYDQATSESSTVIQFGGAPGDAIRSQTTVVSGEGSLNLGELIENSSWILGKGRAVAKASSEQESKLFFQTEDFGHDGIQEEEITNEVRGESRNAGAIHIGGATPMVDGGVITGVKTEGILSNS